METSDYRHRAYHKTCYQMPATSFPMVNTAAFPMEKDNRLVAHFAYPGIEKKTGAMGFAYGSEKSYTDFQDKYRDCRHRFDDRTSAERLKLKKQQKEAEQDIEAHQERKAQRLYETVAEKKRDLEMLQTYKPWGRETGGGAPRITQSGTRQIRRQRMDFEPNDGSGYGPFGKSGGGAPLKTGSGKLQTSLKADPNIRFQDKLKKEVNEALRYKPNLTNEQPYYAPKEEPLREKDSEVMRKLEEREKKVKYAMKLEQQQLEARERKKKERAEVSDNTINYPWGKNQVDRDESGKIKSRKWMLGRDVSNTTSEYPGLAAQLGREGAGAPLRGKSGKPRTRITGAVDHVDASTGQDKDIYNPWGRPGAGAPMKDQHGHSTGTGVYGACTEKRSAHEQVVANKREAERGYGMEVASWMRTGEVGMPKARNPVTGEIIGANKKTSDVTAIRHNIRPSYMYAQSNGERGQEYFTELQLQAESRHKEIKKQKEAERKLELEHIDRVTKMWDGGEKKVRSRQRAREAEPGSEKHVERKLEYYYDLQKMIKDQNEKKRNNKANVIQSEKEHIATFDKVWGRPGAGAPRLDNDGQPETIPRNNSLIKTQVYNGWNFRRT